MSWAHALVGLLALPALWAADAGAEQLEAREFVFPPLIRNKCQPSCTLEPSEGQTPFTFSYGLTKDEASDGYAVEMTLNNTTFNLKVHNSVIRRNILPFNHYHFPRLPHRFYSLRESMVASNIFRHYFVREGDAFHYLGRYGDLGYDTDDKLFTVLESPEAPSRLSYYRLDSNRFHCEKGQCNGTKPDKDPRDL